MRARTENSLKDFYLAGSGVGFLVLVLTLYATQYSGNTLFAFTGKTFRIGYAWLMSVHFMMAIIVVYLVFAPRLHRLAKRESFITPADFLEHRFSPSPVHGAGIDHDGCGHRQLSTRPTHGDGAAAARNDHVRPRGRHSLPG